MFDYKKALTKASKGYKVWNSTTRKYEIKPEQFKFALRFYKGRQTFENSTGKCSFDPNTGIALSYRWWVFVRKIKGRYFFNRSSYSPTTGQHQSTVSRLLRQLGIKPINVQCGRKSLSLDACLQYAYENLFQLEIEAKRKGAKSRAFLIARQKAEIKKLRKFGAKCSKALRENLKTQLIKHENERLQRLGNAAAQRKRIRDRIKTINTTEPTKLSSKELLTEPNAEIRRMLFARIGGLRVLKELKAQTIDTFGTYELVNLDLGDGRQRPYLKMLNPSTGETHVEGVPPNTLSVKQALAWRNHQFGNFVAPTKLT